MQLLDDLVYPYQGLETITWASDINNSGKIIATAKVNEKTYAVLLAPVSEPLPEISFAPTSHDFRSIVVYYSSSVDITISNLGDADLTVSEIVLSDNTNFSLIGPTTAVIGPGGSHVITVDFNLQSTGQSDVTVTHSAYGIFWVIFLDAEASRCGNL